MGGWPDSDFPVQEIENIGRLKFPLSFHDVVLFRGLIADQLLPVLAAGI